MNNPRDTVQQKIRSQAAQLAELPEPDPFALEHSAQLTALIREAIQAHGALPFSEYMNMALYTPGLGYYAAGSEKLGEGGDFTTAPETSPLFARCMANALLPVLQQHRDYELLEVGAGSGSMAKEILLQLEQLQSLPAHYHILELSADLRDRQQQAISTLNESTRRKVLWQESLPENFKGIVLANELLDAMPVELFRIEEDGVHELRVECHQQSFRLVSIPTENPRLVERVTQIEKQLGEALPTGYVSEVNFAAEDWIRTVGMQMQEGLLLLVDYGYPRHEYYHPQRTQGTLLCHYRHRAHDQVFYYPGLQDITAHVDFTAMADAALDAGMKVAAYTTQAHFLLNSGLMSFIAQSEDPAEQMQQAGMIRKLTLPQEMGEVFKVMILTKGDVNIAGTLLTNDMRRYL